MPGISVSPGRSIICAPAGAARSGRPRRSCRPRPAPASRDGPGRRRRRTRAAGLSRIAVRTRRRGARPPEPSRTPIITPANAWPSPPRRITLGAWIASPACPLLALALLATAPRAPDPGNDALARAGGERHDHARRLGYPAYRRADRRRRGVRDDLCAGGGRFRADRGQLPDRARPHRGGPGAGEDAIWADLRQRLFVDPVELQKQYAAQPGVAEDADECLGRRAQFLPGDASRRPSPRC